jgi:glycosyltransferase involved in cell wall biosynthesis
VIGIGLLGIVILWIRLRPPVTAVLCSQSTSLTSEESGSDSLAIIIPARNEALRIRPCLETLTQSGSLPANWKVIVIDDQSTDQTVEVVREFPAVHVQHAGHTSLNVTITEDALPSPRASGKCAACQQAADAAGNVEWLLFTDADTEHDLEKIKGALKIARDKRLDLITSLPFYLTPTWWEKLLAPFYSWITLTTNAHGLPTAYRLYANGQFLLFRAASYRKLGGHHAVSHNLAEDLAFARRCIQQHLRFGVITDPVYKVRMYTSFADFYRGWRRLYQIGFTYTSPMAVVEIFAGMAALTAVLTPSWLTLAVTVSAYTLFVYAGRRIGKFPAWSFLFAWISFPLFIVITLDAGLRRIFNVSVQWRSRQYIGQETT